MSAKVYVVIAQYPDRSGTSLLGVFEQEPLARDIVEAIKACGSSMLPIYIAMPLNVIAAQDVSP